MSGRSSAKYAQAVTPLTVTADQVRLATQRLNRLAPDLLDAINPTVYPPASDRPTRRALPRRGAEK